jgi:hypothetical protein
MKKTERKRLSDGREVEILTFSGGAMEIHEIKANGERVDLVESGEFDTLEEGLDFVEENAQAGKATKFAEAKEHLDGLLKESKLPDVAKERLVEQFENSEGTDGMKEAIEDEVKYLAQVAAGKVRDLGEARFEERKKRFQRSGLTPEEAEVAAIGHGADPRKHDRKRSFQRMGLTEAEAEAAARGRP